jgi:hypothetical protein
MTTPSSPSLYSEAKPARFKEEKTASGERSTAPNQPSKRHPPFNQHWPALTRLERSHTSPLFAGISQLVSAVFQRPQ